MQLTHVDEGADTSSAIRGGDREFKTLLVGEEEAPDNFRVVLVRQKGKVVSPRHKHNFDQIRFALEGGPASFGPGRTIEPGELAYFPEGAPYGPEDSDCERLGVTLQFGGASGEGFINSDRTRRAMEEMKAFGTFEKGVFRRSGPLKAGERRNSDGFEAVWEYIQGRKLNYPEPRYNEPILIRPHNFSWQPQPGESGVSIKKLGCFSERQLEIAMLRIEADASARIAPRPGWQVGFAISGAGRVGGQELRRYSAFSLERGEGAEIEASEALELLLIGLPIFGQSLASEKSPHVRMAG